MKDGNLPGYTIGLVEKYGEGIIEELKARKRLIVQYRDSDYKEISQCYGKTTKK